MVRPSFSYKYRRRARSAGPGAIWQLFVQMTQKVATTNENPLSRRGSCSLTLARRERQMAVRRVWREVNRSFPLAQRALLSHRGYQRAVLSEDHAAGEPAAALRARRVLGIQQPFVGTEWPVKPHRVIEARRHHPLVEQGAAVTGHRGV